jgi:hypothetical protein
MDPHERTCRFPIIDGVALRKPRGRAMVMRMAGKIVIYPWIWGRQPTANVVLQLVTCEVISVHMPRKGDISGYERSILFTWTASFCIRTSGQS